MIVFGVGCLFFLYHKDIASDEDFSIVTFKEDIIDAIEKVENVSNLEYSGIDEDVVGFRSFEYDEDDRLLVNPPNFSMSFDIFIPKRVQVQYGRELDVETIHIDIVYGYDRPVMYCSYEWDHDFFESDPSQTVVVVRKFLEQKLTDKIVCRSIACSPVHADFSILEKEPNFTILDYSRYPGGYGRIQIATPAESDAKQQVISRTLEIFSSYYYLSTLRSKLLNTHRSITTGLYELINRDEDGFFRRFRFLFTSSSAIDRLQKEIISEKLLRMNVADYIFEASQSDHIGIGTALQRFFDEYHEMIKRDAWGDFSKIANFFEDRRQRIIANFSVLFAGIFGGIIGALLGATSTFLLTKRSANISPNQKTVVVPNDMAKARLGNHLTMPLPHKSPPLSTSTTAPDTAP